MAKAKAKKSNQAAQDDAPETQQATEWAKEVFEHLVETQKKWIEITQQQNALVLKAVGEGINFYRNAPTPALGEWVKQGVEGFVEAQKRWAEMASQQSSQLMEAMRDGAT